MSDAARVADEVAAIVDGGEESDAILRAAIERLAADLGAGAGIRFVEEGALADGPWAGAAGAPAAGGGGRAGAPAAEVPIRYDDEVVAELVAGAPLDDVRRAAWERVAELLAPYCLVGWDIGGEAWEP